MVIKCRQNTMVLMWSLICILILTGEVFSKSFHQRSRMRRQVTSYQADTLVVVDSQFVSRWISSNSSTVEAATATIKEYISLMAREANIRLSSLQAHAGYSVLFNIVNVIVNQRIFPSSGSIQVQGATNTFTLWVNQNGSGRFYDHVVLITGLTLYDGDDNSNIIVGRAPVGTLCDRDGNSISVISDPGGLQGGATMAHEFGHCLGAVHDGQNNACPGNARHLMAADDTDTRLPGNLVNPWSFSTCSSTAIENNLSAKVFSPGSYNCLNSTSTASAEFIASEGVMPGQRYSASTQCQMIYGGGSTICVGGDNFGSLSDICTSMYCLNPASAKKGECRRWTAAEGTTCGDRMWCREGQCVQDVEDAPELQDKECPYGDTVTNWKPDSVSGVFCSTYVAQLPGRCYFENVRSLCCDSCREVKSQYEVCPYGDRLKGCTTSYCNHTLLDGSDYNDECCGTCNYVTTRVCADVTSIDDVTCDVRVNQAADFNLGCYNSTVAYHCCKTCQDLRTDVAGCEYGDQYTKCSQRESNSCDATSWAQACCQTCNFTSSNNDPNSALTCVPSQWTPVYLTSLSVLLMLYVWNL